MRDAEHKLDVGKQTELITIKGVMQETAGNDYQGLSINGISISVSATQAASEQDSFSDRYDAAATFEDDSGSGNGGIWYKVEKIPNLPGEISMTGAELGNYSGRKIEGLARAAGYTFQGICNKQFWDGTSDFRLTLEKVSSETGADLKITKEDGTVDYIKIILEGQKAGLGRNEGASLYIMDDGIEKVELLESSRWVIQGSVDHYDGWSCDLCYIKAKN